MPKRKSFEQIMRDRMKADGRSLYRIALDAGVAVQIVQRFVKGERSLNLRTADKLCATLKLGLTPVD